MADRAAPPSPHPTTSRLVGREREQVALRDALASALAGRGSLILIGGEAGIGKTALAEWLLAEAQTQGGLILVGRCYDLTETPPYGPWSEALVRASLGDALPPPPDLAGGGAASQGALFAAVRDYLAALAAQQPLVLLLDDLHWADPASLDLLRVVARGLADLPLLLLATYRSDELTRRHPLYQLLPVLARETRATRLDLGRLDEGELRALVRGRYGLLPADEDRLVDYLAARSEGNPFFAGELLRALEEGRALRPGAHTWLLGDLAAVGLPALLRQVLDARLDRLGDDARELLAVAAVIGQEVPLATWATVAGIDEDGLLVTIEAAVQARLLTESADGGGVSFAHALIREATYEGTLATRRRRVHRTVGEALAALSRPNPEAVAHHFRQAGDARAAVWLVRAGWQAQQSFALQTAHDRYLAALVLLEQATSDPSERGWVLFLLIVVVFASDLAAGMGYAEEGLRLARIADNRPLQALLLTVQGILHGSAGHEARGVADLEQAVGMMDARESVEVERGLAALEALLPAQADHWRAALAPSALSPARGTLVEWLGFTGHFTRAVALGAPFVAAEPAGTIGNSYADAYRGLAFAHAHLGQPVAARAAFAEAAARYGGMHAYTEESGTILQDLVLAVLPYAADRPAARRAVAAESAAVLQRAMVLSPELNRAPVSYLPLLLLDGDWEAAARLGAEGWAHGRQLALISVPLVQIARQRGDLASAWDVVHQRLPAGRETTPGDSRIFETLPLLRLAAALALDAADLAEARAWLETHDRWLAWCGAILGQADGQFGWADYHRLSGDPALARHHADVALAHAGDPRQPLALLAAHRFLGELDTAGSRHADAAAHLDASLALAEACAAPYERGLTLLALAELRLASDDRDGTRAVLEEARKLLEPLEARPALARAAALADKLAVHDAPAPPVAPTREYPAGLSSREVEVLRLVAQGLTNAQAADRLFITPRTVNGHLTAIYTKLGVSSRAAASRWAAEQGLTGEVP